MSYKSYVTYYKSLFEFAHREGFLEAVFNPKKINHREVKSLHGLPKVFTAFYEISRTLQRLEEVIMYMSWAPRSKMMSIRYNMLQYHLENYYHEAYILKERIKAFLNLLPRIYRHEIFTAELEECVNQANKYSSNALKDYTQARSKHVHIRRMNSKEVSDISFIQYLLSNSIEFAEEASFAMYNHEYIKLKSLWCEALENNFKEAYATVDHVFAMVNPYILTSSEKVIVPNRIISAT